MKQRYKDFATESGFAMWGNEAWRPSNATVDWSCNYDAELEKFGELIDDQWQTRYNQLLEFYNKRIEHLEELLDRSMSMNKTLVDKLK